MPFPRTRNVHVERAPDGKVRQLMHLQQPYEANVQGLQPLAALYVHDVAAIYDMPPAALTDLASQFQQTNAFTGEPVRLRPAGESTLLGTSTISYVQTLGGLPIWEAGFSVTLQGGPNRVTSSFSTYHHDAKVETPGKEFRRYGVQELLRLLGLHDTKLEVTSQRRLIYRFAAALRSDP